VMLLDGAGKLAERTSLRVDVASDSAERIGHLHWSLPPGTGWRLACKLLQNGRTLATNEYDLGVHDGIQPTMGQRLWAWLSALFLP
jgi:hypothetical protein